MSFLRQYIYKFALLAIAGFSWADTTVKSPKTVTLADIRAVGDTEVLESFIFSLLDKTQDLSYQFLEIIFGPVVSNTATNFLIAEVFKALNIGVLSVMSIIIGYSIVLSVIATSQDSTGAFSQRVSPWTLFRTVFGVSMILPLNNGYCALQVLVMQVVLMGIGFANTAWVTAVNYITDVSSLRLELSESEVKTRNKLENQLKPYVAALIEENIHQYTKNCVVYGALSQHFKPGAVNLKALSPLNPTYQTTLTACALFDYDTRRDSGRSGLGYIQKDGDRNQVNSRYLAQVKLYRPTLGDDGTPTSNNWNSLILDMEEKVSRQVFRAIRSYVEAVSSIVPKDGVKDPVIYQNKNAAQLGTKLSFDAIMGGDTEGLMVAIKKETDNLLRAINNSDTEKQKFERIINQIAKEALDELVASVLSTIDTAAMTAQGVKWAKTGADSTKAKKDAQAKGWLAAGMHYRKFLEKGQGKASADTLLKVPDNLPPMQLAQVIEIQYNNPVLRAAKLDVAIPASIIDNIGAISDGANNSANYATNRGLIIENIIPNISGKIGSTKWIYGAGVDKPVKYMVIMIQNAAQTVLGLKIFDPSGGGVLSTFQASISTLKEVVETGDGNLIEAQNAISSSISPDRGLLASFVSGYVDPIDAAALMGKDLISFATTYYSQTITALYQEMKDLAWSHYGAILPVALAADAATAAVHASPGWPGAVAAKLAKDVTIAGLNIAYAGTKTALNLYVPMGTALAGMFLALGVMLGVYIPLMPFMLFLFGAVSWLMSVAEALVAAPLVGLGITHPEGHDLLGKAEQAVILLLGVFIRPITILFGLFMAILTSQVIFKIFNIAFAAVAVQVIADAMTNNANQVNLMLGIVVGGTLLVYVYAMISIIEQSYALIYQVPDRILRWVGGPQDQSMVGQLAEQAKGESQQAAGQVGSGAGAATKGPDIQAQGSGGNYQAPKTGDKDDQNDKGTKVDSSDNT
jgi:hypothetical protein